MSKAKKECEASDKKSKLKNHVTVFERTAQKSEMWIAELHEELSWMSADNVYHLLRATLQALRDQLNINEAAHFASQLPLLLRGTFYECWDPKVSTKGISKQEFLKQIQQKLGPDQAKNFDLEEGVVVVLKVIFNHISKGEIKDILSGLKPSLKEFIEKTYLSSRSVEAKNQISNDVKLSQH